MSPEQRVRLPTVGRVTVQVGPLVGEVETTIGLDLPTMRDELAAALSGPTLTGGTSVESVEHDFSCRAELANGKGSIRGSVTTQFQQDGGLTFVLTTDQSFLGETFRQIDATLASS